MVNKIMSSKAVSASQLLESLSDAIVQVAEKVSASVVRVGSGRRFGGTGVVWSSDGYVVTANHVVGRLSEVEVGLRDGRSIKAKVVGHDQYSDVALLKIEEDKLTPIEAGDSEGVRAGQFVLALANPFGEQPSVTSGIITSPKRTIRGWWGRLMENVIVTDAPLNPGYSGGPLVDAAGRMIGLNAAYVYSRGIAVPISAVKHVADRLMRDGRIKRAYLGIVSDTISLPEEIAKQSTIQQDEGLIVLSVAPDSPAKRAGLAMGDVIVKFDQKPVSSVYDLHGLLSEEVIAKGTKLSILRGEKLTELTITPNELAE